MLNTVHGWGIGALLVTVVDHLVVVWDLVLGWGNL